MICTRFTAAGLLGLLISVSTLASDAVGACQPVGRLTPICGLRGSEDIEVLPGGKALLVSQSRVDFSRPPQMLWLPGSIAVLDLATRKSRVAYPARTAASQERWGDPACPGEIGAKLAPHGMHLSRRPDGRWLLLVVNHGERESVEMFELLGRGAKFGLAWRGCAVAPEHSFLNDVAALPDGGFLVTNMTYYTGPDSMMRDRPRAERGENTGHVWQWQADAGYRMLPGSETPMPNGIQVDKSGDHAFINVGVSSGGVRKLDLKSGKLAGFVKMPNPDNASWAADGRLLVAGLVDEQAARPCMLATFAVPCGAKFYVNAIDPDGLSSETLLIHAGAPMGGATVAVSTDRFLYVGSFAGDRVLRVPLPGSK